MADRNRAPGLGEKAVFGGLFLLLGGMVAFGATKGGDAGRGSGIPEQRDPNPAPGHVGSPEAGKPAGDHHPLPWYSSDKGPDGRIDYFAHKHTVDGVTSFRIDGGTPAPASAGPEHAERPEK